MAHAVLIKTSSDFGQTLAWEDFVSSLLVQPSPNVEKEFRETVDYILGDLPYTDQSDRDLIGAYLRTIEQRLAKLLSMGFAFFVILSKGKIEHGKNPQQDWRRAYYLVVPVDGFFRVGKDTAGTVHRFDPNCDDAVAELLKAAKDGTPIATWADKAIIGRELEGNVPWCVQCG